jgi:hypothetical protein
MVTAFKHLSKLDSKGRLDDWRQHVMLTRAMDDELKIDIIAASQERSLGASLICK